MDSFVAMLKLLLGFTSFTNMLKISYELLFTLSCSKCIKRLISGIIELGCKQSSRVTEKSPKPMRSPVPGLLIIDHVSTVVGRVHVSAEILDELQ